VRENDIALPSIIVIIIIIIIITKAKQVERKQPSMLQLVKRVPTDTVFVVNCAS
jgi:hypothetical protein